MAISTTTLKGTDSVSGSRITINENIKVIADALNEVLSIVDIATGKINNFGFGTDSDIETEDLIVRGSTGGGVSLITGNINVNNGNVYLSGFVEFGSGSSVKIEKNTLNFNSSAGTIDVFNISGTGGTGASGAVGYLGLPKSDTTSIEDLEYPAIGALVYDIAEGPTGALKVCVASGVTGTWKTVSVT